MKSALVLAIVLGAAVTPALRAEDRPSTDLAQPNPPAEMPPAQRLQPKGLFGWRTAPGRKQAVADFGGSEASEAAVEAALRWFKKHQSPNGAWEAVGYPANCSEDPKCEPGTKLVGDPDVAMTGYALLCFLGAGYDHHQANQYRASVKKGVEYLLSVQKADGMFGERNYEHAIATMALAEAVALSGDAALKVRAQRAVDLILAHQNGDFSAKGAKGHLAWDYVAASPRNDSSVSGWNVMALKSALAAGCVVKDGLEGAKRWLDLTWKATNPTWAKLVVTDQSRFPYTFSSDSSGVVIAAAPAAGAKSSDNQDLAGIGAACAAMLGHHAGDVMLETLVTYVIDHDLPKAYPCNGYKLYYDTLAVFQVGGERWQGWNGRVRDLLVKAQCTGRGCFDGSWDRGTGFIGSDTGRVLSTALSCLTLEVYYRYSATSTKR